MKYLIEMFRRLTSREKRMLMKTVLEAMKVFIPTVAVIGAIILGVTDKQTYGAASIGVLSSAVSGFYGALIPATTPDRAKKEETTIYQDEDEESSES